MRTPAILAGAAAAGLLAAVAAALLFQHRGPMPETTTSAAHAEVSRLPDFALRDLEGRERRAGEWAGQVVVLKFWATWCPPCRREMPAFRALQDSYGSRGVQFVGIAIDDADQVEAVAREQPFNFPILLGNDAPVLAKRLGNRSSSLPFTVVVDRSGEVRIRHVGGFRREALERALAPLL